MQNSNEKTCAVIRILPSDYSCGDMCDLHVVHQTHDAFIASMRLGNLDEIKDQILERHSKGIDMTQITRETKAIVTLTYDPGYFNDDRPYKDFVIWIESLWNRARAHHRRAAMKIRDGSRC